MALVQETNNLFKFPEGTDETDGDFWDFLKTSDEEEKQYSTKNKEEVGKKERKAYKNKVWKREHKVGRNDKCPCGSGKKYKKCCLDSGKYERYTEDIKREE